MHSSITSIDGQRRLAERLHSFEQYCTHTTHVVLMNTLQSSS